jgi:hypothetical protein
VLHAGIAPRLGAGERILELGELAQDARQLLQREKVLGAILLPLEIPGQREFQLAGLPLGRPPEPRRELRITSPHHLADSG